MYNQKVHSTGRNRLIGRGVHSYGHTSRILLRHFAILGRRYPVEFFHDSDFDDIRETPPGRLKQNNSSIDLMSSDVLP